MKTSSRQRHSCIVCTSMYYVDADRLDVNRVRTLLSSTKPEENPSTGNALYYHICWSFYQASRWKNAHVNRHENSPTAEDYGGFKADGCKLVPIMMTTEAMPDAVLEVFTCSCKWDCNTRRCLCQKATLKYTLLCHKSTQYRIIDCLYMYN